MTSLLPLGAIQGCGRGPFVCEGGWHPSPHLVVYLYPHVILLAIAFSLVAVFSSGLLNIYCFNALILLHLDFF